MSLAGSSHSHGVQCFPNKCVNNNLEIEVQRDFYCAYTSTKRKMISGSSLKRFLEWDFKSNLILLLLLLSISIIPPETVRGGKYFDNVL